MVCFFKELAEIGENEAKLGKIGENWSWRKDGNLFTCISSCRSRGLANMCIDMRKIKRVEIGKNRRKLEKIGKNWKKMMKIEENWRNLEKIGA